MWKVFPYIFHAKKAILETYFEIAPVLLQSCWGMFFFHINMLWKLGLGRYHLCCIDTNHDIKVKIWYVCLMLLKTNLRTLKKKRLIWLNCFNNNTTRFTFLNVHSWCVRVMPCKMNAHIHCICVIRNSNIPFSICLFFY